MPSRWPVSCDTSDLISQVGAAVVLYTGGFTHPARLRASGFPVADTLLDAVSLAREL